MNPGPVHLNVPIEEPLYPSVKEQKDIFQGWEPSSYKTIVENNVQETLCNFDIISKKVKEEINKLGKLSIYVARRPNQKEMIELMKEKFILGKKIG